MVGCEHVIFVRPMLETDRRAWAEMRHRLWDDAPIGEHDADIARILKNPKYVAYIAVAFSSEPAGFAEISIRDFANGCNSQPVPFLEGIWVEPAFRRRGIGRAFVERITKDLIERGFRELGSDALLDNQRSHQAHRGWGFEETERVVYFRKRLGQASTEEPDGSPI